MAYGLKVRDFSSKEQVRDRLSEKIIEKVDFVENVEFGDPEVFQKDEVNRIPVSIETKEDSSEDWDLYIPEKSLKFWNGSNYDVPNFDRIARILCESILYYKSNGN